MPDFIEFLRLDIFKCRYQKNIWKFKKKIPLNVYDQRVHVSCYRYTYFKLISYYVIWKDKHVRWFIFSVLLSVKAYFFVSIFISRFFYSQKIFFWCYFVGFTYQQMQMDNMRQNSKRGNKNLFFAVVVMCACDFQIYTTFLSLSDRSKRYINGFNG